MNRILVVDDDDDMRNLLAYWLRRGHYEVLVAVDGVAALEAVEDAPPDVVLTDWMMPRMTGLELCYELRSRAAFDSTAIFLITANTDPGDRLSALAAGADGYFHKPFKVSEIVECVDRYIAQRLTGSRPLLTSASPCLSRIPSQL